MKVSAPSAKHNVPPEGFFISGLKIPGVENNNGASLQRTNSASSQGDTIDPNNGDDLVVLGQQLPNPYTVANMQQAVNILYGGNFTISATHYYVRFKPNSVEQFVTLEDTEDLELQDYPMDHEVIIDGDYWQDPSLGTEDWHWLYTVVPIGYVFPQGIQHQIIESLYLPNDNEVLEDMAESMAGGAQYQSLKEDNSNIVAIERVDEEAPIFNYSGEQCPCFNPDEPCPIWPDCGTGGGGGGGTGLNQKIPRGIIEVQDIVTCNINVVSINVALRQAKVVCKRWFKTDRTFTNDQGQFTASKKFKNKVKIIVKTKNNFAKVSKVRGIRYWQLLFPAKKRIGVYDEGAMANVAYVFTKSPTASKSDRLLPYWVAATTHNTVVEYRQYAAEMGVAAPPMGLKILVTNWNASQGAGSAPMWNKCFNLGDEIQRLQAFISFAVAAPGVGTIISSIGILVNTLKNQLDITIGYQVRNDDYNCRLTSADIKSIGFHELGHSSHFVQAGCDFWRAYRVRITNEIAVGNPAFRPYGDGTETNAGVVAIGEMWGGHCEKIFSERHYGNGRGAFGGFGEGFTSILQITAFPNIPGGLNANLNAIENFNPNINIADDPHRWIPQGLPYDLIDDRNDFDFNATRPIDEVLGFTTLQCFNALQSEVRSIPEFRTRILQQNGNNQLAQINNLFSSYGC